MQEQIELVLNVLGTQLAWHNHSELRRRGISKTDWLREEFRQEGAVVSHRLKSSLNKNWPSTPEKAREVIQLVKNNHDINRTSPVILNTVVRSMSVRYLLDKLSIAGLRVSPILAKEINDSYFSGSDYNLTLEGLVAVHYLSDLALRQIPAIGLEDHNKLLANCINRLISVIRINTATTADILAPMLLSTISELIAENSLLRNPKQPDPIPTPREAPRMAAFETQETPNIVLATRVLELMYGNVSIMLNAIGLDAYSDFSGYVAAHNVGYLVILADGVYAVNSNAAGTAEQLTHLTKHIPEHVVTCSISDVAFAHALAPKRAVMCVGDTLLLNVEPAEVTRLQKPLPPPSLNIDLSVISQAINPAVTIDKGMIYSGGRALCSLHDIVSAVPAIRAH